MCDHWWHSAALPLSALSLLGHPASAACFVRVFISTQCRNVAASVCYLGIIGLRQILSRRGLWILAHRRSFLQSQDIYAIIEEFVSLVEILFYVPPSGGPGLRHLTYPEVHLQQHSFHAVRYFFIFLDLLTRSACAWSLPNLASTRS